MSKPIRILLQTTIAHTENDWTIERFSLLREYLNVHELMRNPASPSGLIDFFPAHATGTSQATRRPFNLSVAFERSRDEHGNNPGRAVAESSFHHFVDYNWDIDRGCPGFVEEPPGSGIKREPDKLEHVKRYVRNLALWLAPDQPL
jgi:hypothetical protein